MDVIKITPENINKLGDILYNIREERNVAQADVAETMKRGQPQISGMEHTRKIPGLKTLVSYLEAVGGWKLALVRDTA